MTYTEHKRIEEMELEVFERNLRGIIETELALSDPKAPGVLDTIADDRKVLADPILLRKAAQRFRDLFWANDAVTEIEQDTAAKALAETARTVEPAPSPFSIIRDGRRISLTSDEVDSFRLAMQRDEVAGALDDWLDTLDPDHPDDEAILKALKDGMCRDKVLGSFGSSLLTEMLKTADDADLDAYQRLVDKVFRPIAERVMEDKG